MVLPAAFRAAMMPTEKMVFPDPPRKAAMIIPGETIFPVSLGLEFKFYLKDNRWPANTKKI